MGGEALVRAFMVAVLAGCGPRVLVDDQVDGGTTGGASSSGASSSSTTSTSSSSSSTSTSATDGSSTSGGFQCEPPSPDPSYACETWIQNCPAGQKCILLDESTDEFGCVPLVEDSVKVGDPCGVGPDGGDPCERGAFCGGYPETTCIEYCSCDHEDSPCTDRCVPCSWYNGGACFLQTCDPLDPAVCDEYYSCQVLRNILQFDDSLGTFVCLQHYPDYRDVLEPCSSDEDCAVTLTCSGGAPIACTGDFCCLPWCDVTAPDCPTGLECIPLGEYMQPGCGWDDIGICGEPEMAARAPELLSP